MPRSETGVGHGEMSIRDAARLGGQKTKERGSEYYAKIGHIGGTRVLEKRGLKHYSEMGKKGGAKTKATQGEGFYERIGRLGGPKSKKPE